jgi:hypothetical protein
MAEKPQPTPTDSIDVARVNAAIWMNDAYGGDGGPSVVAKRMAFFMVSARLADYHWDDPVKAAQKIDAAALAYGFPAKGT